MGKTKSTKNNERRKLSPIVITALIGIFTALLASPIIQCWLQPYTCKPPQPTPTSAPTNTPTITLSPTPTITLSPTPTTTPSPTPTISISSVVKDTNGQPIGIHNAPFQVSVSGTVSNADGLYVYLIVVDKNHHYVQPGLGANVNNDFSNLSFLGEKDNPEAGGQQYTIYAVVTDKPYPEFAWFEGESFLAKSKELKLTRAIVPTPTP